MLNIGTLSFGLNDLLFDYELWTICFSRNDRFERSSFRSAFREMFSMPFSMFLSKKVFKGDSTRYFQIKPGFWTICFSRVSSITFPVVSVEFNEFWFEQSSFRLLTVNNLLFKKCSGWTIFFSICFSNYFSITFSMFLCKKVFFTKDSTRSKSSTSWHCKCESVSHHWFDSGVSSSRNLAMIVMHLWENPIKCFLCDSCPS